MSQRVSKQKITDKLIREDVINFYIVENHSLEECLEHYNIKKTSFQSYLHEYNILKDKKLAQQVIKRNNLAKYGCISHTQTSEYKNKIKKQNIDKYGVEYYFQTDEYKAKATKTLKENYKVEHPLQCKALQEKAQNTLMQNYGVKSPLLSQDIKDKVKQTNRERYGVDNPFANEEVKAKIHETWKEKHGVEVFKQKNITHIDIWSSPCLMLQYLQSLGYKPTVFDLCKYFNCDETSVRKKIHSYTFEKYIEWNSIHSQYEDEIVDFLYKIGVKNIKRNDRSVLKGQEIDIYLPDYNTGIEFNGDYWHSDIYKIDHNGRSLYHQNKSLLGEQCGIFLFHIFEYEWTNSLLQRNIKSRLKVILGIGGIKIPARKCKIIELTKKQKKDFLNSNHIQGNDHSTVQYGLLYHDELVACMTFVHPKNNKYTWELSRFCNKQGYIIQGGASKLFKNFVKTLKTGDTVSSYSDITKTKGTLYEKLGFNCTSVNAPNYIWINFNTRDVRSRYQEQAAGEVERMHKADYHRICDCGTKTWVYTKR